MKIAFIAHAIGVGGGSLSSSTTIQYLLDAGKLKPEDCIIIHDKVKGQSNEKNDLYFNLKNSIKSYECILPFSPIYKGAPINLFLKLYSPFKQFFLTIIFFFRYNTILRREGVTTIHLNSMVLWPLLLVLPKSMNRVIHIREVPDGSIGARIAIFVIIRYATKIISIDPISDLSFSSSGKSIVIINPFDMTQSRTLRAQKKSIKAELGIPPDAFIVSLFGTVGKEKGLDFFIDIVKSSVGIGNLVFLVIGKTAGTSGDNGVKFLQEFKNVKYLGEHTDTRKYFAITDVVIRCEDYLPLGRTVWEGIFSGGLALIPVNKNDDITAIKDYFGKYIFTYQASNVEACIQMLKKIMLQYPDTVLDSGYPVANNISTSAEKFYEIIQS